MMNQQVSLVDRARKLGLVCDELSPDSVTSPVAALACFPMYMVANVHAWTADKQFRVPVLDIPGFEAIREAFTIGKQESKFDLARQHRHVLSALLQSKPADLIIYEYALETLQSYLEGASPAVAQEVRIAVARMIVAVAKASGEGMFGSGDPVSPEERECIAHIAAKLNLSASAEAAAILAEVR